MNSVALRSDCNKARPVLVFAVTKNVREELRIRFGFALRAGLAITGAKAPFLLANFGTAKAVP